MEAESAKCNKIRSREAGSIVKNSVIKVSKRQGNISIVSYSENVKDANPQLLCISPGRMDNIYVPDITGYANVASIERDTNVSELRNDVGTYFPEPQHLLVKGIVS